MLSNTRRSARRVAEDDLTTWIEWNLAAAKENFRSRRLRVRPIAAGASSGNDLLHVADLTVNLRTMNRRCDCQMLQSSDHFRFLDTAFPATGFLIVEPEGTCKIEIVTLGTHGRAGLKIHVSAVRFRPSHSRFHR